MQDLNDAVQKMKSYLRTKKIKPVNIEQDEIESLGLGMYFTAIL